MAPARPFAPIHHSLYAALIAPPAHREAPFRARAIDRIALAADGSYARQSVTDQLVVEAPLELRVAGEPAVVLMRTPGHDRELAGGLMFAEGVIDDLAAVAAMHEPPELSADERGHVLELGLPAGAALPRRSTVATASCGVCGKVALADLEIRASPVLSDLTVSAHTVAALPERLRAAQATFELTGGLHAAGAFATDGTLLAIREDVGRHNALDKLVGWALAAQRVPMSEVVLCVSGRLSFEIVQKAVVAGIPMIVAVSAPSSLAVDVAERFRVTLCGFTRDGRFNVYSHGSRVT